MPTKSPKSPKKTKRVNWKALAQHRQEALAIMADIQRAESYKLTETLNVVVLERSKATFFETQCEAAAKARKEQELRADAAERHNAELLREVEELRGTVEKFGQPMLVTEWGYGGCLPGTVIGHVDTSVIDPESLKEPLPTRWQRFKAWIGLTGEWEDGIPHE